MTTIASLEADLAQARVAHAAAVAAYDEAERLSLAAKERLDAARTDRVAARVDMPPRGNRGSVMQTIEARRRRAKGKKG